MMNDEINQYEDGGGSSDNTLKGYRIVMIIMAIVIAILAFQYYKQVNMLKDEKEFLAIEKDTLQSRLSSMIVDLDNIKSENDTISQQLSSEKYKADSLFTLIKKERSITRSQMTKYKKEIDLLKTVVTGYVKQIDSLNRVNVKLAKENTSYRNTIASAKLRADAAEEKNQELSSKIQKGAVVRARDIVLTAVSHKDKVVDKARHATRLRVNFVLNANEMASVGVRDIFIRILAPDGVVLADSPNSLFEFNGEKITYSAMRSDVDYQGEDLPVAVTYSGSGIINGRYNVEIYMDGHMIGSNELILK